jgi:hypothetical protein
VQVLIRFFSEVQKIGFLAIGTAGPLTNEDGQRSTKTLISATVNQKLRLLMDVKPLNTKTSVVTKLALHSRVA